MKLSIGHLYPDVLNLYGDRGNIVCLQRRLAWRGMESEVKSLPIGAQAELRAFDLIFIGGGQDFEQEVLLSDLRGAGKDDALRAAVSDGVTFLCICGGYQMMGHYYETAAGQRCEFLGAVDFHTVGAETRMIGNYAFALGEVSGGSTAVGFENHSGRTWLGHDVAPLGRVLRGFGNNGEDGTEGARYKNVFGSYSHGPLLPKNPALCDYILETALSRHYGDTRLEPLPDLSERAAHDAVLARILRQI